MTAYSLTGSDTLVLNNRVFADFADADWFALTYPNPEWVVKVGKNGNGLLAFAEQGKVGEVVLRLVLASADDQFLNSYINSSENDPASTILLSGTYNKVVGDGSGDLTTGLYKLDGGVITKRVEAKSNADGDIEQSVAIYNLTFCNAARAIT